MIYDVLGFVTPFAWYRKECRFIKGWDKKLCAENEDWFGVWIEKFLTMATAYLVNTESENKMLYFTVLWEIQYSSFIAFEIDVFKWSFDALYVTSTAVSFAMWKPNIRLVFCLNFVVFCAILNSNPVLTLISTLIQLTEGSLLVVIHSALTQWTSRIL